MAIEKKATVHWEGRGKHGKGQISTETGALSSYPYGFASRFEGDKRGTNPEEILGAAHAACFAMAMNAALGKKGGKAAKTHVTATVSADKGDSGIKIVSSKLKVVVEGLEGMSPAEFATFVKEADKGCPVSNAYRGTMQIEVEGSAR